MIRVYLKIVLLFVAPLCGTDNFIWNASPALVNPYPLLPTSYFLLFYLFPGPVTFRN